MVWVHCWVHPLCAKPRRSPPLRAALVIPEKGAAGWHSAGSHAPPAARVRGGGPACGLWGSICCCRAQVRPGVTSREMGGTEQSILIPFASCLAHRLSNLVALVCFGGSFFTSPVPIPPHRRRPWRSRRASSSQMSKAACSGNTSTRGPKVSGGRQDLSWGSAAKNGARASAIASIRCLLDAVTGVSAAESAPCVLFSAAFPFQHRLHSRCRAQSFLICLHMHCNDTNASCLPKHLQRRWKRHRLRWAHPGARLRGADARHDKGERPNRSQSEFPHLPLSLRSPSRTYPELGVAGWAAGWEARTQPTERPGPAWFPHAHRPRNAHACR